MITEIEMSMWLVMGGNSTALQNRIRRLIEEVRRQRAVNTSQELRLSQAAAELRRAQAAEAEYIEEADILVRAAREARAKALEEAAKVAGGWHAKVYGNPHDWGYGAGTVAGAIHDAIRALAVPGGIPDPAGAGGSRRMRALPRPL